MKLRETFDLTRCYRWWFEDAIKQAIEGSAREQKLWMRWKPAEDNAHHFINEYGETYVVKITVARIAGDGSGTGSGGC